MSQENVEIVRRAIDAFNRRDLDGAMRDTDAEVEVDWSRSRGLQAGIYRGQEAARGFWASWLEMFDQVTNYPDEFIECGEHVVVPTTAHLRGRDGVEVKAKSVAVVTLHSGRILEWRLYQERAEALEAVGLSELAMSQENVEIVRRLWRAAERGDDPAVYALYDRGIVWKSGTTGQVQFGGGPYYGHEGVRQFFLDWFESFGTYQAKAETFIEAGDKVVVGYRVSGRGRESGVDVEMPSWNVYGIRNGLVVHVEIFETKAEALEAVGLSEQDAHADTSS